MLRQIKIAGVATSMVLLGAAGASAATVTVSGTKPADQLVGFNEFVVPGGELEFHNFVSRPTFTVNGNARLTFTEVGAESGFNNMFSFAGLAFSESGELPSSGSFADGETGTVTVASGSNLGGMTFSSPNGYSATPYGTNSYDFGVFYLGDGTSLTSFFIAYDDMPGLAPNDDNHDDYIIRVDVAPVPIPAAGFLLVGALGGLAALRRRKKAATA